MDDVTTQYVKTAEGYIAYQVFGDGPPDILFLTNWSTNLEVMWEEPTVGHFFGRLASMGRVICFDKRGTGISDPVPLNNLPSLEDWMDDAREVLNAAGSEKVVLIGDTEGGPMAILFAATYPERISAFVLVNTYARMLRDVDYTEGMPDSVAAIYRQQFEQTWGTGEMLVMTAPAMASDPRMRAWMARYQRLAMAPGTASKAFAWVQQLDVRPALASISAPTLVIQRAEGQFHRAGFGRYLAKSIPGAKYVELPGMNTYPFHAPGSEQVLDEIQEFVTGVRPAPEPSWVLATIMFTDIVNSTQRASEMGDSHWAEVLQAHDTLVRQRLGQFRGREIRPTGDGFLATFDGPARAINCAATLSNDVRRLGLEIRVGLHTGLVEETGPEIGGLAVHIANRVMSSAEPGSVFVSRTVKDLVVGSGFTFVDKGRHTLKGVPDDWELFAIEASK